MKLVKVTFSDGDHLLTTINGTEESIRAYFIGSRFDHGDPDGPERFVTATDVEFIGSKHIYTTDDEVLP